MARFDFTVYTDGEDGWAVRLPHQCDEWTVTGDAYDYVSHAEAVESLAAFIAEAQAALAELVSRGPAAA